MLISRLTSSGVVWLSIALACLYCVATVVVDPEVLIEVLNGVFLGSFVAVTMAYWRTIGQAFAGVGPYDRVRHYALGVGACWLALIIGRVSSVYFRSLGDVENYSNNAVVGLVTFIGIVAAVLQITAPGLDSGYAVGREKRFLYLCAATGGVVAIILILLQGLGTGTLWV